MVSPGFITSLGFDTDDAACTALLKYGSAYFTTGWIPFVTHGGRASSRRLGVISFIFMVVSNWYDLFILK
jgi:hypothetical protein